jgi:predicted  nucleic acid-binding Zn-ribbon protein
MQQDILKLLEVQEKEREMLRLAAEKERLPRALEEARANLAAVEREGAESRAEAKKLQVQKKDLELESESKLQAVAKYEQQQFQVKSNVDYQALQKEIVNCRVENSRIEDRLLEVMEKLDECEKRIKGCEEKVAKQREQLAVEEKVVAEQVRKVGERISALTSERDRMLPGISAPVLRKYQRIFANKRDTAVVPLVGYTCGGCHMRLPPQIASNVRTEELVICESCSRILYWPEGLEKKEESAEAIPSDAAGQ